jgi:hypothetical protein
MRRHTDPWPFHIRIRYVASVAYRVLVLGDTIGIRVLMATASLLIALGFLLDHSTFDRPKFATMALVVNQFDYGRMIGPAYVWALLFSLHGFGVFWRILEGRRRIFWAVAINWLGLVLWVAEVTLTIVALRTLPADNALALPAVVAMFIALVRTGLNDEKISP